MTGLTGLSSGGDQAGAAGASFLLDLYHNGDMGEDVAEMLDRYWGSTPYDGWAGLEDVPERAEP